MRSERKHGATARALREAAILYAAAVDGHIGSDEARWRAIAWDALRRAALRYAREPRPEGRPRK